MELTLEEAKRLMDESAGSLDLSGTCVTSLPEDLTVGGSICMDDVGADLRPEDFAASALGGLLRLRPRRPEDGGVRQEPVGTW